MKRASKRYISWLYDIPTAEQAYMAAVYIESMREDSNNLTLNLHSGNKNATLSTIHKMKGGCDQIGATYLSSLLRKCEKNIKNSHSDFNEITNELIKFVNESVKQVEDFKDNNLINKEI